MTLRKLMAFLMPSAAKIEPGVVQGPGTGTTFPVLLPGRTCQIDNVPCAAAVNQHDLVAVGWADTNIQRPHILLAGRPRTLQAPPAPPTGDIVWLRCGATAGQTYFSDGSTDPALSSIQDLVVSSSDDIHGLRVSDNHLFFWRRRNTYPAYPDLFSIVAMPMNAGASPTPIFTTNLRDGVPRALLLDPDNGVGYIVIWPDSELLEFAEGAAPPNRTDLQGIIQFNLGTGNEIWFANLLQHVPSVSGAGGPVASLHLAGGRLWALILDGAEEIDIEGVITTPAVFRMAEINTATGSVVSTTQIGTDTSTRTLLNAKIWQVEEPDSGSGLTNNFRSYMHIDGPLIHDFPNGACLPFIVLQNGVIVPRSAIGPRAMPPHGGGLLFGCSQYAAEVIGFDPVTKTQKFSIQGWTVGAGDFDFEAYLPLLAIANKLLVFYTRHVYTVISADICDTTFADDAKDRVDNFHSFTETQNDSFFDGLFGSFAAASVDIPEPSSMTHGYKLFDCSGATPSLLAELEAGAFGLSNISATDQDLGTLPTSRPAVEGSPATGFVIPGPGDFSDLQGDGAIGSYYQPGSLVFTKLVRHFPAHVPTGFTTLEDALGLDTDTQQIEFVVTKEKHAGTARYFNEVVDPGGGSPALDEDFIWWVLVGDFVTVTATQRVPFPWDMTHCAANEDTIVFRPGRPKQQTWEFVGPTDRATRNFYPQKTVAALNVSDLSVKWQNHLSAYDGVDLLTSHLAIHNGFWYLYVDSNAIHDVSGKSGRILKGRMDNGNLVGGIDLDGPVFAESDISAGTLTQEPPAIMDDLLIAGSPSLVFVARTFQRENDPTTGLTREKPVACKVQIVV